MLLLISSLVFSACSDDPASIGGDTLPGDDFVNLLELNPDSVRHTSTALQRKLNLADADRVLLGKANNNEAFFLVRFNFSALNNDTIKTQIKNGELNLSSTIEMDPDYSIGSTSSPFNFSVHKVNSEWTSKTTLEQFQILIIESTDLSGPKNIDSLHTFPVNNEIVNNWLLAYADTSKPDQYGILFRPDGNIDRAYGYTSINLRVVITKKDNSYTDTLTFSPADGANFVTGPAPNIPQGNIALQGGTGYNGAMNFTLPALPAYTTINRALLQLTINENQSHLGTPKTDSLVIRFLTGTADSGVQYDSSQVILMKKSGNKYEGDIARYVQRWLNGQNNNGIILSLFNERVSLDQLTLFGSQASDPANRPKLYITYTSKK